MIPRYLTFGILLAAITVQAQTNGESAVKPELMNHIYVIGDSSHLNSLEKGKVTMVTKMKLAGFGGSSSAYKMEGNSSSVRIPNSQPQFAIKMSGTMGDPTNYLRLYKFKTKNNVREATITSMGPMGAKADYDAEGIPYLVKNPSDGIYILVPEKILEPGEYVFVNMMMTSGTGKKDMAYAAFAFAIDR